MIVTLAIPNGEGGLWSSGEEGDSAVTDNVFSGNVGPGLRLEDGGHTVVGTGSGSR